MANNINGADRPVLQSIKKQAAGNASQSNTPPSHGYWWTLSSEIRAYGRG
jgi:hypothetical protein